VRFANRLRLIIENSPAKAPDALLGIEASFGVDVYEKGDQQTEKEFVEKVDSYLYLAKQEGRNRVCHRPLSEGASDTAQTNSAKK